MSDMMKMFDISSYLKSEQVENSDLNVSSSSGLPAESSTHSKVLPKVLQLKDSNGIELKKKKKCDTCVACRFAGSGCKEFVVPGSIQEKIHTASCDFRSISCNCGCGGEVAYHTFIIHLQDSHFMCPNYGNHLRTSLIISSEHFNAETKYIPKWLSFNDCHFFLNIQRNTDGFWMVWISVFGDEKAAVKYYSKINLYRAKKCLQAVSQVHSIRKTSNEILMIENGCLYTTDEAIKDISRIGSKIFTDITLDFKIFEFEKSKINPISVSVSKDAKVGDNDKIQKRVSYHFETDGGKQELLEFSSDISFEDDENDEDTNEISEITESISSTFSQGFHFIHDKIREFSLLNFL